MSKFFNSKVIEKATPESKYVLEVLNRNGHQALFVGGCVRDCLLGKTPSDWDITTSATPAQIKAAFDKTYDTGIKHGTVTVVIDNQSFEVTTFRIDGEYTDKRKPDSVMFTTLFYEDAARRDFTINALGADLNSNIYDYFNGYEDIQNKTIRTVGDAEKRFSEDALRMLRAIRFSAQLGYEIHSDTLSAITKCGALIAHVSNERIRIELEKLICSSNPAQARLLHVAGLLPHVLPELELCYQTSQNNKYHLYNVGEHSVRALEFVPATRIMRLATLLHDIGKPLCKITNNQGEEYFPEHAIKCAQLAETILKNLKYDNNTIKLVCEIILHHTIKIRRCLKYVDGIAFDRNNEIIDEQKMIRRMLITMSHQALKGVLKLRYADKQAQAFQCSQPEIEQLKRLAKISDEIIANGICVTKSQLAIDGNDLKTLGYSGKEIAQQLNKLLEIVVEQPSYNIRDYLLKIAAK